jgi:hypothetical protein
MKFQQDLTDLINKHKKLAEEGTPDEHLINFIDMFNQHFVIGKDEYIKVLESELSDMSDKLKQLLNK